MRLLWLPDALRAAGLTVIEYPGWEKRGSSSWGPLRGVICHATASSRVSKPADDARVIWETGSSSAPAPISQIMLDRTGTVWVGASGRCNHVKLGDRGPFRGMGNSKLLGIEAVNDNNRRGDGGEPWPAVQLDAYTLTVAVILDHERLPASTAVAHTEHQSDKSDPHGIDMSWFRREVADLLASDLTRDEDEYMYVRDISKTPNPIYVLDGFAPARPGAQYPGARGVLVHIGPGAWSAGLSKASPKIVDVNGIDPDAWVIREPDEAAPVTPGSVDLTPVLKRLDAVEAAVRLPRKLDLSGTLAKA